MIDVKINGYFTICQLSEYLNVKTKTLYAWVASGDIPHYRIGRLIRFRKEEIEAWMEGNKTGKKEEVNISALPLRKDGRQKKRPAQDIDRLIKKTIDQVKGKSYTPDYGKSDHKIEDLIGKEVRHGSI